MRLYETAFLIIPNLSEEETEQLIQQMSEVVTQKKGKMVGVDKWGKRKIAYQIQKFEDAFYVFFLYEGTPDIPSELERRFKQDEKIIRWLTVKKDEKEELKKKKTAAKTKKTAAPPKEEAAQDFTEEKKEMKKEEKKEEIKEEKKEEEKEKVKDEVKKERKKEREKETSELKKTKSDKTSKEEE